MYLAFFNEQNKYKYDFKLLNWQCKNLTWKVINCYQALLLHLTKADGSDRQTLFTALWKGLEGPLTRGDSHPKDLCDKH